MAVTRFRKIPGFADRHPLQQPFEKCTTLRHHLQRVPVKRQELPFPTQFTKVRTASQNWSGLLHAAWLLKDSSTRQQPLNT